MALRSTALRGHFARGRNRKPTGDIGESAAERRQARQDAGREDGRGVIPRHKAPALTTAPRCKECLYDSCGTPIFEGSLFSWFQREAKKKGNHHVGGSPEKKTRPRKL